MSMSDIREKAANAGQRIWYKTGEIVRKTAFHIENSVRWAVQNPEKAAAAAAGAAAVIGGANKLVRSVNRNVTARRELRDKRYRVYDRSLGAFVYTKRPIDSKMIDQIYAERRRTGKRVCEIMAEKGLLRK